MDKKVRALCAERANGYCEYCGVWGGDTLHCHHILRRVPQETTDNCVMLCLGCHTELHGGKNSRKIDLDLKYMLQAKYEKQGLNIVEIRKLMGGKLYI